MVTNGDQKMKNLLSDVAEKGSVRLLVFAPFSGLG